MTTPWPPEPLPPKAPFREHCWRLLGPSGKPVTCSIEQVAGGYELRAEYDDPSDRDFFETHWEPDLGHARIFADKLRARLLKDGTFTEIREEQA